MSVRLAIVEADPAGLNVAAFCREHGISTWLFWELRRRYRAGGVDALEPRSRAPHRVANRIPAALEDEIVALRKQLAEDGLDNGPASIAGRLGRRPGLVPSESTIWRVLSRRGCIVPDPAKAPRHAHRSFSAERANECWQLDDTRHALADGTGVKILNIIDDCTRLAVASAALEACTTAAALDVFLGGAREWGLPARFLSDNAPAFRHGLADAVAALGVGAGHARPYHPQTCGKVERFHQSQQHFLDAQPPAATLAELQDQLDRFRHVYNHDRPHRSLDRRTPAAVWTAAPKAGPDTQAVTTPTRVHRSTVTAAGTVPAGRYRISIGAAHALRPATTIITGTACHVFIDGRLARALTLNPNKRQQPLHNRPGRPRQVP